MNSTRVDASDRNKDLKRKLQNIPFMYSPTTKCLRIIFLMVFPSIIDHKNTKLSKNCPVCEAL